MMSSVRSVEFCCSMSIIEGTAGSPKELFDKSKCKRVLLPFRAGKITFADAEVSLLPDRLSEERRLALLERSFAIPFDPVAGRLLLLRSSIVSLDRPSRLLLLRTPFGSCNPLHDFDCDPWTRRAVVVCKRDTQN